MDRSSSCYDIRRASSGDRRMVSNETDCHAILLFAVGSDNKSVLWAVKGPALLRPLRVSRPACVNPFEDEHSIVNRLIHEKLLCHVWLVGV